MNGASLSRWTMTCFAASLAFLVLAQALMLGGYGFPATAAEAPETLVVVHIVTIGWLSMLMLGALFQFVPVLTVKPLLHRQLVLPALLNLLVGLACLLAGFLQLAGTVELDVPLLPFGGVMLVVGFGLSLWVLAHTLAQAWPMPLPARFVAVGLACVAATALFGLCFTLMLSGVLPIPALAGFTADAISLHAAAGFGGWLTFTAIGVSYRLLPMFMLASEAERKTSRAVWWCGSMALLLVLAVLPICFALAQAIVPVTTLACLLGAAALALYGFDLVYFYRSRRRRTIELNSKAALGAFAALYLSVLLLAALAVSGKLAEHAGALLYLVAFGWLTGLGLSQLYKIVPFLTWLECYGPVMGRRPTPRVQDLVVERRDGAWFVLFYCGVMAGTGSLLASSPNMFRLSTAATLLATVAIMIELMLARRLFNVAAGLRLPEGTMRPRLFLPPPR